MLIYGSSVCPYTVYALAKCKEERLDFTYRDISGAMCFLREFLQYRDEEKKLFKPIKAQGSVGIPFFVFEDGTKLFDLEKAIKKAKK